MRWGDGSLYGVAFEFIRIIGQRAEAIPVFENV
jgi:site-specific DNA-cytosine methylase